jgi:prepilin peptidase CpaA
MVVTYACAALVGIYTAAAAVIDIREHRIPNYLTVSAAVLGVFYNAFFGIGIGWSLAGLAIGFSLLFLPWILGGGGMGDVKLLAALGSWLGVQLLLVAFGLSAVLACIIAVGVMLYNTFDKGVTSTKNRFLGQSLAGQKKDKNGKPIRKRRVLPFAVPVCLSTWLVLLWYLLK